MTASRTDRFAEIRGVVLAALLAVGLLVTALRGGSYAPIPREEFFVVILWLLAMASALGLLPRYRMPRTAAFAVAALVILAAWTAVGLLWTESAERTVIEVARTLGFAGLLLLVVCAFGGCEWEAAAGLLTAAAVVVCAVALVSRLAPDLLNSPLVSMGLYRRLAYPLNYWNGLGSWAAMTVALALAQSAHARSRFMSGAALAGVCLAAATVYLTYSRSAAIGVVLAALGVAALSRHRWQAAFNALLAAAGSGTVIVAIRAHDEIAGGRGTDGASAVAAACGLVAAVCLLAGAVGLTHRLRAFRLPPEVARTWLGIAAVVALVAAISLGPSLASGAWESFEQRPERGRGNTDPAERLGNLSGIRLPLWQAALGGFSAHPMHGTGAGTFEYVWNRNPRRDTPVQDAHSLYVEALGELGLPGALLFVLALGGLLMGALRAPFRQPEAAASGAATGCAVALAVFCLTAGVDWLWELTAVTALGLACGGLAAVAGARRAARPRLLARIGITLMALLWLAVQLPVLVGAIQVNNSREAIREGRVNVAMSDAATAIDVQPWAASGYLQRALVLERAAVLPLAAADARRAAEREPTNWETWLILARIEAERGRVAAALRAARRARALNPRSPLFRADPRGRRANSP